MHYVISDIHNDNQRFCKILKLINFSNEDHLFILGDVFDRSDYSPNPVDLYFNILSLGSSCTVLKGNHDSWLASYIFQYYAMPEWKRRKTAPYPYNTFRIITRRLTEVDLQNLANEINGWKLQLSVEVDKQKYLLAHAMTSNPEEEKESHYYLMGHDMNKEYRKDAIDNYISICGHRPIGGNRIWKNDKQNLYMIDCGCGFENGRLGCLCLETKEEFYV